MFQKKMFLNFLESGDQSCSGVQLTAWNVTKEKLHQTCFLATYLKLLTNSILTVGQLRSTASSATASTSNVLM